MLFFIFLFFAFSAKAQEITIDTSFIINSGGNFFEISRVVYSNGTYTESSTIVGDTTAMLNRYVAKIESEANAIAAAAQTAYRMRQKTSDWAKLDTITTTRLGRSPITAIADVYEKEFLQGNWQIEFSGTTTSVTFPRLSTNKRIRMLPATGVTARTMLLYGNVLRIVNYPFTGLNTIFKLKDGYWINLDFGDPARRIVLRRTSN